MIKRRPPTLGASRAREHRLQRRVEHLEIHQSLHTLKIIALGRQLRQALVDIKKSGRSLGHVRSLRDMNKWINSTPCWLQVFGGVQLAYKPEHAVDHDTGVIVAAPIHEAARATR
jgi:hypothetical protein